MPSKLSHEMLFGFNLKKKKKKKKDKTNQNLGQIEFLEANQMY